MAQPNFITLDSVINDYIDESEQSISKYAKLYNIAFRGMEKLGLDFFYKVRSVKLPILSNKTVALPSDYINYTKIGVLNSKGEIIPLKFNQKLTYFADQDPNRNAKTQDNTLLDIYNPNAPTFYNYYNGYGFENIYGLPSGSPFVGSFNIDAANGIILLNENFYYDYLMIEYIASPDPNQQYVLPMVFREALLAWIAWRDIASLGSTKRGSISDKRAREHDFYNQRRLANAAFRPLYLNEAYEQNLTATRLTVKS
jgi:hypothetical protein